MSKWYEVKVTTVRVLAVEIDDEQTEMAGIDAALRVAMDNTMDDAAEAEITGGPYICGDVLEAVKRHADEVIKL